MPPCWMRSSYKYRYGTSTRFIIINFSVDSNRFCLSESLILQYVSWQPLFSSFSTIHYVSRRTVCAIFGLKVLMQCSRKFHNFHEYSYGCRRTFNWLIRVLALPLADMLRMNTSTSMGPAGGPVLYEYSTVLYCTFC